jgi:acetyl-CoA acetyltransferase
MMRKPHSLKNKSAIVGVGESDISKVPPHMIGLGLNAQAAKRAINDACLKPSDIDGLLTPYSFTEPYFMLGSVMCEYLGIKPHFNGLIVVGGGSPGIMLKHAAEAIAAGQAEVILICAGENRASGQSRDAA